METRLDRTGVDATANNIIEPHARQPDLSQTAPRRLRAAGFATVGALRARPYSPRVYVLLNAPFDVQRWPSRMPWNGRDGSRGIPEDANGFYR